MFQTFITFGIIQQEQPKCVHMTEFSFKSSITAVEKQKLSIARHFIQSYLASRGGLKELGILRTDRNLQGDYAEWLVSIVMDLKLVDNTVQKGYDAKDSEGRKYQVKSRIVKSLSQNTSFDFRTVDSDFDFLVGVFLSPLFEPLGIIKVSKEFVVSMANENQGRFSFRWRKKIMNETSIERIFWQDEIV